MSSLFSFYTFQKIKLKRQFEESIRSTPPCLDNEVEISYMNTGEVRKALHIKDGIQDWDVCR